MLCSICQHVAACISQQDFSTWTYNDFQTNASLSYPLGSYNTLIESGLAGCELCRAIKPTPGDRPHDSLPGETPLRIECSFSKADATQSRSIFHVCTNFALAGFNGTWSDFEFFIPITNGSPAFPTQARTSQLPQAISPRADSARCVALAQGWLKMCETSHECCARPADVSLPTRILDILPDDGSEDPRLLESQGLTGRYVTLSYCWGKTGHLMTTKETIRPHESGIPIASIPKTLRDAVQITRQLGFRYLWIDALCIVQDDPLDWEREAARMCSIYENSIVCLAALDADGSDKGFLHPREDFIGTLLGDGNSKVGIREPTPVPQRAMPSSQLESRAWTLQERALSPASLVFGRYLLYWECCKGWASECRPEIVEHRTAESDSYYSRSVHDLKLLLRSEQETKSAAIWYELLHNYTYRALTNPNDRLPAIQGLATKFWRCIQSPYVQGMWMQDIHHGLLWSVGNGGSWNRLARAPSWSWASLEAPIDFPRVSRRPVTLKARIELSNRSLSTNGFVETGSCLLIEGQYQSGFCYTPTSKKTSYNYDFLTYTCDHMLDRVKCTLDSVDTDLREGWIVKKQYFCLLLTEEKHEGVSIRSFLILEEAEQHEPNEAQLKSFKRAGIGWQELFDGAVTGILSNPVEGLLLLV